MDYSGTILVVLAGFIAIPFYLTYISKGEYGLWLAINSVVLMVALIDLATDQFLTTITSNDEKFYSDEYPDYLTIILIIKTISAVIVIGVSSLVYILLESILGVEVLLINGTQLTFILAVLGLIFGIYINTLSTILYARHNYSLVNMCINIFSIVAILMTCLMLKLGYGIIAFPSALLISVTLQGLTFLIIIKIHYPQIKIKIKECNYMVKSEILVYTSKFQALRWLYTFRTQYISIAITNLIGASSLSQYMLTSRLAQLGPTFSAKFAQAFFPSMANQFAIGDIEKASQLFTKSSKVLARFAIFSGIFLITLNKSFVAVWVGVDKYAGNEVLVIIIIHMMIYIAMSQFAIVIFASKKFEKWVYWGLIEILLAIFLSYYLSLWLGLVGVVIGFFLSTLPTQIYLFKIVLYQLNLDVLKFIKEIAGYAIKPNIIPLIIGWTIIFFQKNLNNWADLIEISILLLLSHFILEVLLLMRSGKIGIKNKIEDVLKL